MPLISISLQSHNIVTAMVYTDNVGLLIGTDTLLAICLIVLRPAGYNLQNATINTITQENSLR